MDIRDCNEYRTRRMRATPVLCIVCGSGPCSYPSREMLNIAEPKASPPTPKLTVLAIAMERIDAGDMVRVETDLATGMTYARKA